MASRACLICGGLLFNANFGVDSCRACAGFYKRTVTSGRRYVCRAGDGKCTYKKHEKFTCRSCRMKKCRELGMSCTRNLSSQLVRDIPDSTSLETPPGTSTGILETFEREYVKYLKQKRRNEEALRACGHYRGRSVTSHDSNQTVYVSSIEYETDEAPVYNVHFIRFISTVFCEFNALSAEDKKCVFKNAIKPVALLESVYTTQRLFAGSKRFIATGTSTCFDMDHFAEFLPPDLDFAKKIEITSNIKRYWSETSRVLYPLLREARLSNKEFAAVYSLLVWSFDFSEDLHKIGMLKKQKIILELSELCVSEDSAERAVRIGLLTCLVHAIQECAGIIQEEFQIMSLLKVFDDDCYVYKTLTQPESELFPKNR